MNQFDENLRGEIPIEVLDKIRSELNSDEPTDQNIKKVMKSLRFMKYYENIPSIQSKFLNKSPPKITPAMKSNLIIMFNLIQEPYQKHHDNPYRTSFPSYALILSLLCDIIGYHDLKDTIRYLRKWLEPDYYFREIWENICFDLEWPYRYPDQIPYKCS
jgi:hypothetical protein